MNGQSAIIPAASRPALIPVRPRDAASLLLVDRSGREPRILMGKRHMRHVFMPGKFVFPGGRTEAADGRVPASAELSPQDQANLLTDMGSRSSLQRCRALALSAIRETYEEAGLFLGRRHLETVSLSHPDWSAFVERKILPDLSVLRYFARATTPPGGSRRFDTRFFLAFRDAVADALPEATGGPSQELEELCWLPFPEAARLDIPEITRTIIRDAEAVLAENPALEPGNSVVRYRKKYGRFVREVF
ncbi:NUDIX hydrolase [Phyllobacterium endophyticum]|uniref:NUDIX hydrolase n=1 Tax=Phyllobacterium endophyticum TaxID=1149773 RepID=A0A2P7AW54_9HYPH|nr:NUDIX hydrolase [Phyllobacterium endophyticum]MBB3235044.1 8-oxo-dGTP pyrophosphatase MutT (NUDIX family) [Phyllobacterium endophyticum]PSH58448.1 NUDIX hydrolase [Phyllobacterium endophyticum]TYR39122.1 NUDIX hydrolase [Phyllobacterium endophyticum]